MGQGSPDTWVYTETGIRDSNGDLVCDDPDPVGCTHLKCNVGVPKINLEDWRGTDSETTTRQKRRALTMLEENIAALKSMPLQELDLDGLRIAVRKTTP